MVVSPLQKMTLVLASVALVSAFGSSFQYGYNVSVINSPAPVGWAVEWSMAEEGVCKQRRQQSMGVGGLVLHALSLQAPGEKWFLGRGDGRC